MKRRYIGITLCLAIALCFTLQYGCVYALTNSAMPAVRGYSITNIGTLGGNYSKAKDINSFGHIVGESTTSDGDIHAFIYIDGTMTDLGTLGGSFSSATGINDKGEVTGVSALETGDLHAFLYRDGVMNDLGTIEDSAESISTAKDINNRGEIGGESNGKAFLYKGSSLMDLSPLGIKYVSGLNNNGQIVGMLFNDRAFLYSGGRVTDLKTLSGGVNSVASQINDKGQVVGTSLAEDGKSRAFLYEKGKMKDLGSLGGPDNGAFSINNWGEIIGVSGGRAFIYRNKSMSDLNNLITNNNGWVLTEAISINDAGYIVGSGSFNGEDQAFLLTPVGY